MRLSELQQKDIIDLNGRKIGNIIDVKINLSGNLESFVIEQEKKFLRFKDKSLEEEISWDKIEKIGEDVILVKIR